MKRLTVERVYSMTEREINAVVFAGAGVNEPRGLIEMLGEEIVEQLPGHPAWSAFSRSFQDWVWYALDEIFERDLAALTS